MTTTPAALTLSRAAKGRLTRRSRHLSRNSASQSNRRSALPKLSSWRWPPSGPCFTSALRDSVPSVSSLAMVTMETKTVTTVTMTVTMTATMTATIMAVLTATTPMTGGASESSARSATAMATVKASLLPRRNQAHPPYLQTLPNRHQGWAKPTHTKLVWSSPCLTLLGADSAGRCPTRNFGHSCQALRRSMCTMSVKSADGAKRSFMRTSLPHCLSIPSRGSTRRRKRSPATIFT
mmetsp:Transcript_8787/g.28105  ORF Transcript_8787/g.28105 Transcript_8787/m.28105 type:complete len:236 (+) Transcript_8787:410-1117(+)